MISKWRLLLCSILIVILAVACAPVQEEYGVLEGHVTIGPLLPPVKEGLEPTPAPEVYAARKIVVVRERDGKEVARLEIDAEGNYRGEFPIGSYVVDINRVGIDSASGFPRVIEIAANEVTRVDVDIDTGIR
jgi:hypothetical protein